jgi:Maltokinase N-terminal cap domain
MAIIHATTLNPSKLELLRDWLPAQPWHLDKGRAPELAKVGGFRLDDPQGEVGIEFMVVADGAGDRAVTYQVPLTYRPRAIASAGGGLIGTAEHGVLGRRWIYDGAHDPVMVAQLIALIQGEAEPQAQSVSNTPDRTVTARPVSKDSLTAVGIVAAASGPFGTDLRVHTADLDGIRNGQLIVRIHRVLEPASDRAAAVSEAGQPCLSANWRLADGAQVHGFLATAQYVQEPTARS